MAYDRRTVDLNPDNADARGELEAPPGAAARDAGGTAPVRTSNGAWRRAAFARLGVTPEGLRALKFNAATLRIAGNHVRRLIAGARRGDQARDARRWTEAARAYRGYLRRFPNDPEIWTQLGHCLKESGDLAASEAAYRSGLSKDPRNADLHLHLGHVLRQQQRIEEAAEAYRRSFEAVPWKAAHDELAKLHRPIPQPPPVKARNGGAGADLIYLEIDDLLYYARSQTTLSGIQRVQVGVIQQVLERLATNPTGYAFVCGSANGDGLWQVKPEHLKSLVDYLIGDTIVRERQAELVNYLERNATLVRPIAGQCYFVLGAFWAFSGDTARYSRLNAAGVVTGVYIYDLIPLTHPEYCDAQLVNDFRLAFGDGFAVFDFALTISEATAREVKRFQEKYDLRRIPVMAVPLSHLLQEKTTEVAPWSGAIEPLRDRPFVLYVSTIEPRKNHPYLVTIWKFFLEEGLDPPDLVLVGRYGWRMADFKEQLEEPGYMGGHVHILHGLSDAQLARLYQSCLFTAFPSFVEGWGLPVGESLAHGRPCVASNTSSIPEVGGDLVDYCDPYNLRDGIAVFRRMAFDADYRAEREKAVRERFVARTWKDVGDELLRAIARLRHVEVVRHLAPLLRAGEMFVPGELHRAHTTPPTYPLRPLRPILVAGWQVAETFIAWMNGVEGMLRFRTELAPATEVAVYLLVEGAPWSVHQTVDVGIGHFDTGPAAPASMRMAPRQFPATVTSRQNGFPIAATRSSLCHAVGRVAADGVVEVRLRVNGPSDIPSDETRRFWVGLVSIAYAEAADIALRTAIMESIALGAAKPAAISPGPS
jgi:glycosyltransferase involved in cell wall biosynthesis